MYVPDQLHMSTILNPTKLEKSDSSAKKEKYGVLLKLPTRFDCTKIRGQNLKDTRTDVKIWGMNSVIKK